MPYRSIRVRTIICPALLALAACDDAEPPPAAGDEITFRACPPNCSGGDLGNTSYAGEWSLANINTAFGVPATNWVGNQASTATLDYAWTWHGGQYIEPTQIEVTADGELRLHYPSCPGIACFDTVLTGAQVIGATFDFEIADVGPNGDSALYWVRVQDYEAVTIHGKPGHVYTLTTNAPNGDPLPDESHYLCYANSAGENSPRAVFLPGVHLNPNQLTIGAAEGGAIIACETGADGKMVLGYGYHQTDLAIPNVYTGALKMTTGDICGTGHAYTTPGRLISIQDSLGINTWSGNLIVREGDYDHTGMICRGEAFRGPDAVPLSQMLLQAPCLQEMQFCGSGLTPHAPKTATFGVKVEGNAM